MPLSNGYGVVIGKVKNHFIEDPDSEGRWPHYVINVETPAGDYQCVINLKSRSAVKIEYRTFMNLNRRYFNQVLSLSEGFHSLAPTSSSGAFDFIRHPGLQNPIFFNRFPKFLPFKKSYRCNCSKWWKESGLNVVKLMQYFLENVERIYIFGEPYTSGLGVHNVHMNQGDPIGTNFARENGIWQDGGVMFEYKFPQPRLSVLLTKFETQSLSTDNNGKPKTNP